MDCNNHKECSKRLQKMIKKIKKEIVKADKLIENYKCCESEPTSYKLNKDEKRQIIDAIKETSRSDCASIESLVKHRTEVKCLLKAYANIMHKYEKLKPVQGKQLDQVKKIHLCVKNELISMIKARDERSSDADIHKCQDAENEDLEKTFKQLLLQSEELIKQCESEDKRIADRLKRIEDEDKRDNILFSLVIKCIRRAFDIQAKLQCKRANFMEYAFGEDSGDLDYYLCDTR